MEEIKIRPQQLKDVERFYEILNNEDFIYFDTRPNSINEEKNYLKQNKKYIKNNYQYNFTILFKKNIIGSVGIKIDQHRKYIGEIEYFIGEKDLQIKQ